MITKARPADLQFAESLFTRGTDCFGLRRIKQVLGIALDREEYPPLPSEEELTRARELGQYLVLEVPNGAKGKPLTMRSLYDGLGNKLEGGKLLYDNSWYAKEPFYDEPITLAPVWKLVSREVIPGSASQNYLGQTQAIVNYVRDEVYDKLELPAPYQTAIEQFESQKDNLARLMDKDWKAAAEKLAALQVNQLFRETPGEVIYRLALYLGVNHEYLLRDMYTWTKSRSSDGRLVFVGRFRPSGAYVYDDYPGHSSSNLGVCFSRSAVPES